MVSNTRVPEAEITGIYGGLLKKMMRRVLGKVPEAAKVMWQHPAVFKDTMGLSRKVEKWNECDENLKSFAHMAAVGLVGCSFCLDLGYFIVHNKGLDEAKHARFRGGGSQTSSRRWSATSWSTPRR
jgi:hypothetical protein